MIRGFTAAYEKQAKGSGYSPHNSSDPFSGEMAYYYGTKRAGLH